jgi:hypothetical protein
MVEIVCCIDDIASEYHNIVQNNTETYDPNIADITNMQHKISKHIPKRFNILTVCNVLKRIKKTKKVPEMERIYAQKANISRDNAKTREKNALEDKKYENNRVKANGMRQLGFEH